MMQLTTRAVRRMCSVAPWLVVLGLTTAAMAQTTPSSPGKDGPAIRTFKSSSFALHTDLSDAEGQSLLERLETMLGFVAGYWGRPHRGIIEMYVARRIDDWPRDVLAKMAPEGVSAIRNGGGLTIGTIAVRGNEFRSKAVVYAVADHGTPQHEAVHAYCNHAFGGTGPVWYAEGMAEVGNYWRAGEKGVTAPPQVIAYLQHSPRKPLDAIVNNPLEQTGDSWQNYAWRWALCHLLGHNTNYAPRFKPLGLQLLNRNEVDFWQVYGAHTEEIEFEYGRFLDDLVPGYRVDLCAWDWKTRFTSPAGGRSVLAKIDAAAGWQASRLLVTAGTTYEYACSDTWSVGGEDGMTTADGLADGRGRLQGVILTDYTLSEPFELSGLGQFNASQDGKLYLRCRDDWGELSDNSGTVSFRAKVEGVGRPLGNAKSTE